MKQKFFNACCQNTKMELPCSDTVYPYRLPWSNKDGQLSFVFVDVLVEIGSLTENQINSRSKPRGLLLCS